MRLTVQAVSIGCLLLMVFTVGMFAGGELAMTSKMPKALRLPDVNIWSTIVWPLTLSVFTGAWVSIVVGRQNFVDHQKEQALIIFRKATNGLLIMGKDKSSALELYHSIEQIESMLKIDLRGYADALKMRGFKRESLILECVWMNYYRHRMMFKQLNSKEMIEKFTEWKKQQIAEMEEIKLPLRAYIPMPYSAPTKR